MRLDRIELDLKKLYELCGKESLLLAEELEDFIELLEDNFEIKMFFEDPSFPAEQKKALVNQIFSKSTDSFRAFMDVIINYEQITHLQKILYEFRKVLHKAEGVEFVELISANKLSDEVLQEISCKIREVSASRKTKQVIIKNTINHRLLGGFLINFHQGKILDASLAGRLAKIKKGLMA